MSENTFWFNNDTSGWGKRDEEQLNFHWLQHLNMVFCTDFMRRLAVD